MKELNSKSDMALARTLDAQQQVQGVWASWNLHPAGRLGNLWVWAPGMPPPVALPFHEVNMKVALQRRINISDSDTKQTEPRCQMPRGALAQGAGLRARSMVAKQLEESWRGHSALFAGTGNQHPSPFTSTKPGSCFASPFCPIGPSHPEAPPLHCQVPWPKPP